MHQYTNKGDQIIKEKKKKIYLSLSIHLISKKEEEAVINNN
jgi:hypothetical protein